MDDRELLRLCGNPEQLFRVRRIRLDEGNAKGETIYQVITAGGLTADILLDHALDIGQVSYRGHNMSWFGKNGYTKHFEGGEDGVTRSFAGGLMYTCGLRSVGPANRDGAEWHPMHGRIHSRSARMTGAYIEGEGENAVIRVRGETTETAFFGESLALEREIRIPALGAEIVVADKLRNRAPREEEYMLLYHCNFGYPLLSRDARLILPAQRNTVPRDRRAEAGIGETTAFCDPMDEYDEQVFFHTDMTPEIRLENAKLGVAASLSWSADTLPILVEWKSMASGDYALGLEPSNTFIRGRHREREEGGLPVLRPFGTCETLLRIAFSDM